MRLPHRSLLPRTGMLAVALLLALVPAAALADNGGVPDPGELVPDEATSAPGGSSSPGDGGQEAGGPEGDGQGAGGSDAPLSPGSSSGATPSPGVTPGVTPGAAAEPSAPPTVTAGSPGFPGAFLSPEVLLWGGAGLGLLVLVGVVAGVVRRRLSPV